MTLAKEIFGLITVITLAIFLNRILTFYGFKRDPHFLYMEIPIQDQEQGSNFKL